MKRFSVALDDEAFARLEALRGPLAKRETRWGWSKPWSRDATAAWLIRQALRLSEVDRLIQVSPDLGLFDSAARADMGRRKSRGV